MIIERKPLRTEVGSEILGRIIDGRLPSGTRINETHLARDLGVSRTPLREAMLCLAATGALDTDPGRGFLVPHFTGREVAELLDALSVLLPPVLRRDGEFALKAQFEARNLLGRARLDTGQPASFCRHFLGLTVLLGEQSPNRTLRAECRRLAQLLLRYLHEALGRGWDPGPALAGLQEGLDHLQQGNGSAAAARLEHVLQQMSTDLAARFPASLEARA